MGSPIGLHGYSVRGLVIRQTSMPRFNVSSDIILKRRSLRFSDLPNSMTPRVNKYQEYDTHAN